MMGRAKQLFDTYWQYYDSKPDFEETDKEERTQWYRVACEEARLAKYSAIKWQEEIDRIKAEAATMVPRKHYTDAVKSLTVCQQQIETLMLELKRWNPTSQIAQDASVVLGLLEAMIDANPDMQTDDYRDSQKQRRDEAERVRREAVVAQIWDVPVGAVGADYDPLNEPRMEDINNDLRDALWVVMRNAAKALDVEIDIVDA